MRQNLRHPNATSQAGGRKSRCLPCPRPALEWYFVCGQCEAKWFSPNQQSICPRCRAASTSNERLLPPWRSV